MVFQISLPWLYLSSCYAWPHHLKSIVPTLTCIDVCVLFFCIFNFWVMEFFCYFLFFFPVCCVSVWFSSYFLFNFHLSNNLTKLWIPSFLGDDLPPALLSVQVSSCAIIDVHDLPWSSPISISSFFYSCHFLRAFSPPISRHFISFVNNGSSSPSNWFLSVITSCKGGEKKYLRFYF